MYPPNVKSVAVPELRAIAVLGGVANTQWTGAVGDRGWYRSKER